MDQQQQTNLKKLALSFPLALLLGFLIGLVVAVTQIMQGGDINYGLWRTALSQLTYAINVGFFTALHLAVLVFVLTLVQLLLGRDYTAGLRTSIGFLLFYPLFFLVIWFYTDLYVSLRNVETHRLPKLIRDNSDLWIYLKSYFLQHIDLWAVAKLWVNRTWWMLSSVLVAGVFGYWFARAWQWAAGRWRKKRSAETERAVLKKKASRRLIPLGIVVFVLVLSNMADKALALAQQGPTPRVILISIDTLRADRLGCYGNERAKTPYLDLLAQNGVLFEDAISNSAWTLPGHGAMLTGVQPTALGLFKVTDRLDSHALTLAEVMREQGFDTGAIVSYILLDRVYGFDQGFEYFDYEHMQPAKQIVDKAIEYIGQRHDQKFFLFLHLYDPHWPYEPTEKTAGEFWPYVMTPLVMNLIGTGDYAQFALKVINGPPVLNEYCLAMYDGEIADVDLELGRLFTYLYEKQLIDDTIVIVTSDHGEEFRDHGTFGHGLTLYDESLRVPLIMRYPRMLPEGVRVEGQVQLLDVFPTVLDLAGIDSAQFELGGRNLYADIHAGAADAVPMIAETSMSGDPRYALRDGHYKLITPYQLDFGGNLKLDKPNEVFDIQADPEERNNLAPDHPKMLEMLSQEMARQMEQIKNRWGMGEGYSRSQALSAEEIEHLRSLGYLN